jgi:hypothetical protein
MRGRTWYIFITLAALLLLLDLALIMIHLRTGRGSIIGPVLTAIAMILVILSQVLVLRR